MKIIDYIKVIKHQSQDFQENKYFYSAWIGNLYFIQIFRRQFSTSTHILI